MMMGFAFVLHLLILAAYQLAPKEDVIQIPVRSLNIKVGGAAGNESANQATHSSTAMQAGIAAPLAFREVVEPHVAANAPAMKALEHLIGESAPATAVTAPPPPPIGKEMQKPNKVEANPENTVKYLPRPDQLKPQVISESTVASAQQMPAQFVRGNEQGQTASLNLAQASADSSGAGGGGEASGQSGSGLGNIQGGSAEVLRRYEQIISLSIQRNKVYPAEAKTQGLQGQAVIRIRINRQGNILYSRIEKPTRYPILNEAIAEMVRLSNPVPAVPVNYPAGNLFEFLIPVSFRLE